MRWRPDKLQGGMTSRRQNQQHSRRKGWESQKVVTSADY